jgi:hypothetical protein
MKYLSLLALCSILLAIPACKNNGCCSKTCTTTTCATTVTPSTEPAVEVGEYVDKEDLDEQELVAVMNNK